MAAIATALLQPNLNSRGRDGAFPLTMSPKVSIPCFSGDSGDLSIIRYKKARLQLARDSSIRGTTRDVDENTKDENQTFVAAQNSADNPKSFKKDVQDDLTSIQTNQNVEKNNVSPVPDNRSVENKEGDGGLFSGDAALKGTIFAGLLLVGVIGGFGAVSYIYREQINDFLVEFSDFIEGYGAAGYALFVAVYAGLEILAIPAIPLTMSAGLLFGTFTGTVLVSISGTIAATAAFLIARYLVRDRILKLAEGNKKFLAIDKAIGENGFRVVALLRLSPLLPFSLGNYLYGLTSVKLVPYVLGSWLGMLPGTWAYVSAGAVGRAIIQQEAENGLMGGPEQFLTLGIGLLFTVLAATYVTRLAKDAVKDIE